MAIVSAIEALRSNPKGIRFNDLAAICDRFFGEPRQKEPATGSIAPWPGDPRVNIQNDRGMAKFYQVRQVIRALEKLNDDD